MTDVIIEFCKKHKLTIEQFYGQEKYSGYLDLRGLTNIPEGFNPTVGGDLDLRGLTNIPEGFNPTVGGYLDLRGLTNIPEGFNPTVGGDLYLRGDLRRKVITKCPEYNISQQIRSSLSIEMKLTWQNGRYRKIDGIFCEVLKTMRRVLKVKIRLKTAYVVTDGINYSHGETIAEARKDLIYKTIAKFDEKLPEQATGKEWIGIYRAVTGACSTGVRMFVEKTGNSLEEIYTAKEICEMVKGEYGGDKFAEKVSEE